MKAEEIEIGGNYYYNNRECHVISREGNTSFFKVCLDIDIQTSLEGSSYCMQCNVGGDYKGGHTCDEANEIIEATVEDIKDSTIIFVPAEYLHKHPIEFAKNEELLNSIEKNKDDLAHIKKEISEGMDKITLINKEKELEEEKFKKVKDDLEEEISNLKSQLEKIQDENLVNAKLLTNIKIDTFGSKRISAEDLLGLIKARLILEALQSGGVDNWTWYGEALGDRDFDAEALQELVNL